MDNRPLVLFPKLWNGFTNLCKSAANKNVFKKNSNLTFLRNYRITISGPAYCVLIAIYETN
jgi:hypothetical protein